MIDHGGGGRAGRASPPAAPGRVIPPLGQVIPVCGGEVSGEMYLLSYAQTAPGARLTVITRARGEFVPPGIEPGGMYRPFAVFPGAPVHRDRRPRHQLPDGLPGPPRAAS